MRKKKFRKITNRNATSIYGKIVKMVAMWERKIFHNPSGYKIMFSYLEKLGPMNLDFVTEDTIESFGVDIKGYQNDYQIYIDITSVGLQGIHNDFHFVLCDGCKVSLTGSSIIIKSGGKLYCARLVKLIRFPIMASDFDGDRLNIYSNLDLSTHTNVESSMKLALGGLESFIPSDRGINLDTFKDVVIGIGSKPEPMKPLPDFPDFTEDDLPPIEDVMNGVSELERQIGEQPRDMQFKIPKDWDTKK